MNTQEIRDGVTNSQEGIAALQADSTMSLELVRDATTTSKEAFCAMKKVGDEVAAVRSQLMENGDGISALQRDTYMSVSLLQHAEKKNEDIHASIGRVEERVSRFQTQIMATTPSIHESIQSVTTTFMDQMRAESQRNEAILGQIVISAMNDVLREHNFSRSGQVNTVVSADEQQIFSHGFNQEEQIQNLPSNSQLKFRHRKISWDSHRYPFFDVLVETFEPIRVTKPQGAIMERGEADINGSKKSSSYTRVRLFPRYGIFKTLFEFERAHDNYTGIFDIRLRTYNVVNWDSAIFKAARNADIITMRNLFETRQASPFDVDPLGRSLLEECVNSLYEVKRNANKEENLARMIELILQYDRRTESFGWSILYFLHCVAFRRTQCKHHENSSRLLLASFGEGLFDNYGCMLGSVISLNTVDHPVAQILLQQDHFVMDWGGLGLGKERIEEIDYIYESDWQISMDPKGEVFKKTLSDAIKSYGGMNVEYNILQERMSPQYYPGIMRLPFYHALLSAIASHPENDDLVQGCLNRMVFFLNLSFDVRKVTKLHLNEDRRLEIDASQYALSNNNVDVWEVALKLANWREFDIMGLIDEARYRRIPELFEGEAYITRKECVEEFKKNLITGQYLNLSTEEKENYCRLYQFHANIYFREVRSLIVKAEEVFSRRNLPGAWPDETQYLQPIEPGENNEFDKLMWYALIPWGIHTEYAPRRNCYDIYYEKGSDDEEDAESDISKDTTNTDIDITNTDIDTTNTDIDNDELEYRLSQTADETEIIHGFERSLEWLLESYHIL